VATVFVDHYSGLDYVHVQESTSALDTIEAKTKFERFSLDRGVRIRHYHADNGIFASNGFREAVSQAGQTISFCGVGAHHQNRIAERRIQDLTQTARTLLAHASHRNPSITAHLWPYALIHASTVRRMMPREHQAKSPEELFSRTPVRPTTKHLHAFGCPVYVLKAKLQSGDTIPKWNERARVGVYLGQSRQHASTVALILNPKTGFISPQFHCVYDDAFDSTKNDASFSLTWATKAGLQAKELDDEDYVNNVTETLTMEPFTVEEIRARVPQTTLPLSNDMPPPRAETMNIEKVDEVNNGDRMQENEGANRNERIIQTEVEPQTTRTGRQIRRPRRYLESLISVATILSLCLCVYGNSRRRHS